MEEKKKINWLKYIIMFLFIVYVSLYVLNKTGYYDGSVRRKMEITSEQIEVFEKDVANGVEIDINNYVKNLDKDYTNRTSKIGYAISSNIDQFLNKGIRRIVKVLSKMFT